MFIYDSRLNGVECGQLAIDLSMTYDRQFCHLKAVYERQKVLLDSNVHA